VNITIKNQQSKVRINKKQVELLSKKIAHLVNLTKKSIITIVFVDNKTIQALNRKYLKHNFPTDVLAFNLSSSKIRQKLAITGDIIVNVELAKKNAQIYSNSLIKEVALYMIHGMLHLLGLDDHKTTDKKRMERRQKKLLHQLFTK